ncbi:MAG: DNA repair protein RecO [Pontibacterium sp.]
MKYRVERQAGYVIHTRPYRDTSMLVDFFTIEHGRVSAVVRGARRPNAKLRAFLQPFTPLVLSWQGRGELKTIITLESADQPLMLVGHSLMCGLYLNELLQRLLPIAEGFPKLYVYYQYALNALKAEDDVELALRAFELKLLSELGYGLALAELDAHSSYQLSPKGELTRIHSQPYTGVPVLQGAWLLAIAEDQYQDPQVRKVAKYLTRTLLALRLGDKPLKSRELFAKRPLPVADQQEKHHD